MEDFADGGAAVNQDADIVLFRRLRDRRVRDAVLRHHAANQQLGDAELSQLLFERRLLKAIGEFLHYDWRSGCSDEDARVYVCTRSALVEEWGNSLGNVLNVNDRNTMRVGLLDGLLNVLKNDIGVPERELAFWEVIVLKINNQ